MARPPNVLYMAACRHADRTILAEYYSTQGSGVELRTKLLVETNLKSLLDENKKCSQGQKFTRAREGQFRVQLWVPQNGIVVACAVAATYPEGSGWALLREFGIVVQQNHEDELFSANSGSLTKPLKKKMKDLMANHEKPNDKISQVQAQVDDVKIQMQENVSKILDNHASLEQLENKTDNMNQQANHFLKQSVDLRRTMQMRAIKVKILGGLLTIAVLLWIFSPLMFNSSDDSPPPPTE